jgi:hypothetical protein
MERRDIGTVCNIGPRVDIWWGVGTVEPELTIKFDIVRGWRVFPIGEDVVLGKEGGEKSRVQGRGMSAVQSNTVRSKNIDKPAYKADNVLLGVRLQKWEESRAKQLYKSVYLQISHGVVKSYIHQKGRCEGDIKPICFHGKFQIASWVQPIKRYLDNRPSSINGKPEDIRVSRKPPFSSVLETIGEDDQTQIGCNPRTIC